MRERKEKGVKTKELFQLINCKMVEENNEGKTAGPSSPRCATATQQQTSTSTSTNNSSTSNPSSTTVVVKSVESPRQPTRLRLTAQQLEELNKDELVAKWRQQDVYLEYLETQATSQDGELSSLRESEEKYRQQFIEVSHREKMLVRRLASKEQQVQEYVNQIAEMKAASAPSTAALRSALLDPAVNILIQKLRQELVTTKAKLEDTQNELSAWKFTPDSNTGKRLMAKCRLLYQENEELGRMIASGRIAKLEGELALQKSFSEEMKKSQSELDEFLQDLDEDVEGMQSTIYFLQQELRKARESVTLLQQENSSLKSNNSEHNMTNGLSPHTPPAVVVVKKEETDESNASSNQVKTSLKGEEESEMCGGKGARTPSPNSSPSHEIHSKQETKSDATRLTIKDNAMDVEPRETANIVDESSGDSTTALVIKVESETLSDDKEDKSDGNSNQETMSNEDSSDSKRTNGSRTKSNNSTSGDMSNGEEVFPSNNSRTTRVRENKNKRDKSAPGSDDERSSKKKRRESILSLDYNDPDDDALLLTNGDTQSDQE